jgi:prepilin-type N-terminal cleavage/methylation domain-containing protein
MMKTLRRRRSARGFTLLEISIAIGIMGAILVLISQAIQVMSWGVRSSVAQSDSMTRTSGTVYDIVAELRQATAYSPHFYIEQDPTIPPTITFDLVAGVDATDASI